MQSDADRDSLPQTGSQQAVAFRDRMFICRTHVFADGSTALVAKSLITVSTAERIAELDQHADFERTDGGS